DAPAAAAAQIGRAALVLVEPPDIPLRGDQGPLLDGALVLDQAALAGEKDLLDDLIAPHALPPFRHTALVCRLFPFLSKNCHKKGRRGSGRRARPKGRRENAPMAPRFVWMPEKFFYITFSGAGTRRRTPPPGPPPSA